jgi:hypothetical protein
METTSYEAKVISSNLSFLSDEHVKKKKRKKKEKKKLILSVRIGEEKGEAVCIGISAILLKM